LNCKTAEAMNNPITENQINILRYYAKKHGAILTLDSYGFTLDCGSKTWRTSQDPILYFKKDSENFMTAIAMMNFGTSNA